MSGLLESEVNGEKEVKKIMVDGDFLVIHTTEGDSYNKIFNNLEFMNALDDNEDEDEEKEEPIEVKRKSSTEILLTLNKKSVGFLHSCDYLSSQAYFKLLSKAAVIKINKEEAEEELTNDITQVTLSS